MLHVQKFKLLIDDMQEVGMLVTLFCIFHVGLGVVLPSLARLRTM